MPPYWLPPDMFCLLTRCTTFLHGKKYKLLSRISNLFRLFYDRDRIRKLVTYRVSSKFFQEVKFSTFGKNISTCIFVAGWLYNKIKKIWENSDPGGLWGSVQQRVCTMVTSFFQKLKLKTRLFPGAPKTGMIENSHVIVNLDEVWRDFCVGSSAEIQQHLISNLTWKIFQIQQWQSVWCICSVNPTRTNIELSWSRSWLSLSQQIWDRANLVLY